VQELYDNEDDGSKLKLTVAEYLTPGDRSIQNIGIVPDVQLQWMAVPAKNDAPGDVVRLLPPSKLFGEQELDAHLVSTYAKDVDKPTSRCRSWSARTSPRRKRPSRRGPRRTGPRPTPPSPTRPSPTPPSPTPPSPTATKPDAATPSATPAADGADEPSPPADPNDPDAEPAEPEEDQLGDDFETRLARDLVASFPNAQRDELLKGAKALIATASSGQAAALTTALAGIGVDWEAPAAGAPTGATLEVALDTGGVSQAKGGDVVTLTATVTNRGTAPAFQTIVRVQSDDDLFRDRELPIGKIAAGERKSFSTRIKIPKDTVDRVTFLGAEVKEARQAPATVTATTLAIASLPPPVFAYAYHLVDDGNGDGLVQPREKFRLGVTLRNTGTGAATETTALLRNASGDGVVLGKSRFELGAVGSGETKQVEFPFELTSAFAGEELVIEVLMYDAVLGSTASEKLHFPITRAVQPAKGPRGRGGPRQAGGDPVGRVERGAAGGDRRQGRELRCAGDGRPVLQGRPRGGLPGFVAASEVAKLSHAPSKASVAPQFWNSTPPAIAMRLRGLEVKTETYQLEGTITDEDQGRGHVRDRVQPERQDRRPQGPVHQQPGRRRPAQARLQQGHPAVARLQQHRRGHPREHRRPRGRAVVVYRDK
jgi:carboxyl-terminal processing protease